MIQTEASDRPSVDMTATYARTVSPQMQRSESWLPLEVAIRRVLLWALQVCFMCQAISTVLEPVFLKAGQ